MSFPTTSWSLILSAQPRNSEDAGAAMEKLCAAYWFPVYAYVRRKGHSPEDSQDLTQEFFCRLIDKRFLNAVERGKGRFRWFLQSAIKGFLANEYDRAQAIKRGGNVRFVPMENGDAERRYSFEPVDKLTPEKIFDRQWGLLLLDRALSRLRTEYDRDGKAGLYDQLRAYLTGEEEDRSYRDEAHAFGMSEGAVRVAVHRMRRRFAETLRSEIAETVGSEQDAEEELDFLSKAIQG